jgi:hypothetical protein
MVMVAWMSPPRVVVVFILKHFTTRALRFAPALADFVSCAYEPYKRTSYVKLITSLFQTILLLAR